MKQFVLKVAKGGGWRIHGDGPAGFHMPEYGATTEELSVAVEAALRRLGFEFLGLVRDSSTRATVSYGRPE